MSRMVKLDDELCEYIEKYWVSSNRQLRQVCVRDAVIAAKTPEPRQKVTLAGREYVLNADGSCWHLQEPGGTSCGGYGKMSYLGAALTHILELESEIKRSKPRTVTIEGHTYTDGQFGTWLSSANYRYRPDSPIGQLLNYIAKHEPLEED